MQVVKHSHSSQCVKWYKQAHFHCEPGMSKSLGWGCSRWAAGTWATRCLTVTDHVCLPRASTFVLVTVHSEHPWILYYWSSDYELLCLILEWKHLDSNYGENCSFLWNISFCVQFERGNQIAFKFFSRFKVGHLFTSWWMQKDLKTRTGNIINSVETEKRENISNSKIYE
jgi:hypothetical protein